MTMENSPRATSAPPARQRPFDGDPGAAGRPVAGGDLRAGGDDGQGERGQQDRRDARRVGVQAEEDEEDRGEQVPQRGQQVVRALGDLAGQGDADQEGADGGGDLELLGDAGDQQGQAEDDQQQLLGVVAGDEAGDEAAVADRDEQDERRRRRARWPG